MKSGTKVCFFVNDVSLSGGVERVCSVIANGLAERNFNVYIISLTHRNDTKFYELHKSIKVFTLYSSLGRGVFRFFPTILKLRKILNSKKIDTLIDVESMLALYSTFAVPFLKVKHLVWEHFNYTVTLGKRSRFLARILSGMFADNVITLTDKDKRLWLSKHFWLRSSIQSIPNPVTLPSNIKTERNPQKIFLAVGRLTYQKGFDTLLSSWSKTYKKIPDWKLHIVGDGECLDSFQKLIEMNSLEDRVELIQHSLSIEEHYRKAGYIVLTSRFEGLPLVLIEAQSLGVPAIAFDCNTGPSDILNNSGWLVEDQNSEELENAMVYAAKTFDSPEYNKLQLQSKQISEKYKLESILDIWEKII